MQAVKYRKDYQPSEYLLDEIYLTVEIQAQHTQVTSELKLRKVIDTNKPLVLNGENQKLLSVELNGKTLATNQYQLSDSELTLRDLPDQFTLKIKTEIDPENNTALEGLYKTETMYCTQCEPHGFRKITYYLDRPDIMAKFTTKIIANKNLYPVLLSNGNLIEQGNIDEQRHYAIWQDPFKKPSYLFALVAGNLSVLKDKFVTMTGRHIDLEIYTDAHDLDKCQYAMECVKYAMSWDEKNYGREYDLDRFMIVVAKDFNMGAMENKGLNIFNSKYVLVHPETSTDQDYVNVLTVIGHEYFHNWTGNRITCRDWFQLSLKEGLTVFRDQEFTADHFSSPVERIKEVKTIRTAQFAEDASPMAHPIRPDSYIEMNNFYTVTVYNKGAEVIRMIKTILGAEGFRNGMDYYFDHFDGQAVTCEDFVESMETANQVDLAIFKRWYAEAGTPTLSIRDHYDEKTKTYTLECSQSCPATPSQATKLPFHIPIKLGLMGQAGSDLLAELEGKLANNFLLNMTQAKQTFQFSLLAEKPTPSLLRDFSAPVKLDYPYTEDQLLFLMSHDSNEFNRWDASQTLATQLMLKAVHQLKTNSDIMVSSSFIDGLRKVLLSDIDSEIKAEILSLPLETAMGELMPTILVDEIHQVREAFKSQIAEQLKDHLLHAYHHNQSVDSSINKDSVAKRRLKNVCLNYLCGMNNPLFIELAQKQFALADNMTDQLSALSCLANCEDRAAREQALSQFYLQWQHDPLVMDKWLAIQASSPLPDTLDQVKKLRQDPVFDIKNPNKVYALIVGFTNNPSQFHRKDGLAYQFIGEQIALIDKINPGVSGRVVRSLMNWKRFDPHRQSLMKAVLTNLSKLELSKDVYEIVSKSLLNN